VRARRPTLVQQQSAQPEQASAPEEPLLEAVPDELVDLPELVPLPVVLPPLDAVLWVEGVLDPLEHAEVAPIPTTTMT
jgi:hypothetical protein